MVNRRPSKPAPKIVDPLAAAPPPVAAAPTVVTPDPVAERRIKELEHQLALARGKKIDDVEEEYVEADHSGDTILIHFVGDGLTINGKTWYKGQELEFTVGSDPYNTTCGRDGRSFLELRNDDYAQIDRWGEVKFREGPWRGKGYSAAKFEKLKTQDGRDPLIGPGVDELTAAERAEQKRKRAAPRLSL